MSETLPGARASYQSPVIDRLREAAFELRIGRLTLRCARSFGFCWGVDKAVTMVHEAIAANPGRRIWLLSPIIHNPTVNRDLAARGVRFVKGGGGIAGGDGPGGMAGSEGPGDVAGSAGPASEMPVGGDPFAGVDSADLVVIPAFSAEVEDMERLAAIGCTVLDTTCPWVERPHRRTERLISEGFSLIIHGRVGHDETRATCSLIRNRAGRYVVVANLAEADLVCAVIRGLAPGAEIGRRLAAPAVSPAFDPSRDLARIGLINQTTMLASESREIGNRVAAAMRARHGPGELKSRFRDYDTICSATQENQDAVVELLTADLDLLLVVGGYESSNTQNLARAAAGRVPTYHIEDATAISAGAIRHQRLDRPERVTTRDWLPAGEVVVGFTAGASTPDNKLGEVILRVVEVAGEPIESLLARV